jgi:hypothetical protein
MDTVTLDSGIVVPFPVESPFAMRPNMRVWQPGEPILIRDCRFSDYIEEKKRTYLPVFGEAPDRALLRSAAQSLQKYVPGFMPELAQDDLVYALTMQLQEDWVLLSPNRQGQLSAQILSVHFPSGWDPREKAGMTFSQLHAPVAENELLIRSADSICAVIASKGPFIRHVWSVANSGALSCRPDVRPSTGFTDLSEAWFRCERQTTLPLEGRAALFLIRVYVAPLQEVLRNPKHRQAMADSLLSMSQAVIEYKGLKDLKALLR